MIITQVYSLKNLKSLAIVNLNASSKTNIDILNNALTRNSPLEHVAITFIVDQKRGGSTTSIKFPKYLKMLKSLTLHGIWHKDFTETLFDMASQRRLKKLSLCFVNELPLPNFSEALSKFTALKHLELSNFSLKKVNLTVLNDFIGQLSSIKLDRVDLSNEVTKQLFKPKRNMRSLILSHLDISLECLNECLSTSLLSDVTLDSLPGLYSYVAMNSVKTLNLINIKLKKEQDS